MPTVSQGRALALIGSNLISLLTTKATPPPLVVWSCLIILKFLKLTFLLGLSWVSVMQATSTLWISRKFLSSVVWLEIPLAFLVVIRSFLMRVEDIVEIKKR